MKKTPIILLGVVFIAIIFTLVSTMSSGNYATFQDAAMAPEQNFTIIGQLNKSKEIEYNPEVNANRTTFWMKDKDGKEQKVIYHDSKPRDIEKSEEITLEGKMVNGEFHAVHLLMKCPSKYTPEEVTNKGLNNTY